MSKNTDYRRIAADTQARETTAGEKAELDAKIAAIKAKMGYRGHGRPAK